MKKYYFAILAVVIALGSVGFSKVGTSENNIGTSEKLNTKFRYKGPTSPVNYTSAGNWEISSDETNCGTSGVVNCTVTPTSSSIDTPTKLAAEIVSHDFAK